MVPFGKKLRGFTDQNRPTAGPHETKFWVFLNSEKNVINRAEKVDEKLSKIA